jgi:hypothetical protein
MRDRILGALATERMREAAAKDCHLIEAALDSDRTVTSLDDTVRELLAHACDAAAELRDIVWVNPNHPRETPIEWLRDDAPSQAERTLVEFAVN